MKYKKSIAALLAAGILGMTGCAENQIPEMTEEEMQEIGEFVAFTLMKYDAGHQSRLMDLPAIEEMEPSKPSVTEEQRPGGMDPVEDTPVVDNAAGEQTGSQTGQPLEQTPSAYSMEEVMGLPEGVTVTFEGHGLYDSYPEESDAFAVVASAGKKLLALEFSLKNTLDQEQKVDLLSADTVYRISVNGGSGQRTLPTMLLNDMASYMGTLAASGEDKAVLLIEMNAAAAESVSSISLNLKNGPKSHTIGLK